MELAAYRDYRTFLRDVLESRITTNPRYSLRAFARDLEISPQMLSSVLNQHKGFSAEVAAEVAEKLELSPADANYFVDLVTFIHSRSPQAKKLAQHRIDERLASGPTFKNLEIEAFHAISDWYHYAILELTFTSDFKNDPKWISERLGISTFEVSQAIERLRKLELLDTNSKGKLQKSELSITASYGTPSSALRKLARQLLQKGIDSLENQSIDERDITNITMAIDPALMPEAKRMILNFRRKLCGFLEQGNRTEVYVFAPSLFRLTKPNKTKKR